MIGAPPSPRQRESAGALLLIRYVRLSGGYEPPDDDCQNGDDRGDHWADGRARSAGPVRMLRHVPATCVARGRRLAIWRRLRKRVDFDDLPYDRDDGRRLDKGYPRRCRESWKPERWIDLPRPRVQDFAVLRDVFEFHPLALEDSEDFGQRAKLDDYDDFVFLVVYGAVPDEDRLVEVHCFYSERCLITVHRDEAPTLTEVRHRYQKRGAPIDDPALLLYRIIDALVDSFFPILADFDDRIDELENQTFVHASDEQLQEIFAMKRLLVGMRKAVTPQRDLSASLMGGVAELPGMTTEAERYFRDIYDHLIRISDLIDTYRDLLSSSMDMFSLDRLQPTQRRDETAGGDRDRLLAAYVHHRPLRPKLRLARAEHRRLARVRRARHRD